MRSTRRQLVVALSLLAPIVALSIVLAATVQFRGALSVDNRTYVEMAAGVREHGLPYTFNKYSDVFPEARPRFNVARHGKLWGNYTPLYPYAAALALKLGGLAAISKQTFLLIGLLAVVIFALGWRLTGHPLRGVLASYLAVFATPAWVGATETLALPLLFIWISLASLSAIEAVDARRWRYPLAALAGLYSGLAVATHLLALPMGVMLIVALTLVRPGAAEDTPLQLPTREGWLRAASAAAGLAVPLVPMGLLNQLRFGTYNPISYGPCVWAFCSNGVQLHVSGLMAFLAPALPYFLVVGVALLLVRRRSWAVLLVLCVAAAALVPASTFRHSAWMLIRTAFGYVVDTTHIPFADWVTELPDGLGHTRGGQVTKSMLQSSPVLVLALLVPRAWRGRPLLLLLPVVGLFLGLALFARFPGAHAFGWPHVILRYTLPATPLLAVLAAEVLAGQRWRPTHVVVAAAVAIAGLLYFLPHVDDTPYLRRFVVLRVTLMSAACAALMTLIAQSWERRWLRELAVLSSGAALGLSVAVSMGVDTRILSHMVALDEARLEKFAKLTPPRFALAGYGVEVDRLLTLRAARDINYIDLGETRTWENFRKLIDLWAADGRPIYGVFPSHIRPRFHWPFADWDVPARQLDADEEFWEIGPPVRRREAPVVAPPATSPPKP